MAIQSDPIRADVQHDDFPFDFTLQDAPDAANDEAAASIAIPAPPRPAGFNTLQLTPQSQSAAGVARMMGNVPADWQRSRTTATGFGTAPTPSTGFGRGSAPASGVRDPARGFGQPATTAATTATTTAAPAAFDASASPAGPAPVNETPAAPARRGFGVSPEAIAAVGVGISSGPSLTPQEETFLGMIERVQIFNDWGVAFMWTQEREKVKLTGKNVIWLKEGLEYQVKGVIKPHSSGESVEVNSFEPHLNPDVPSLLKFIVGSYSNIGVKTATKFLNNIKAEDGQAGLESLRQKLVYEPWSVTFESVTKRETAFGEKGATPADAENPRPLAESPELPYVERMLATKFGSLRQLKPAVLKLLSMVLLKQAKATGDKSRPITEVAAALLTQDPYTPISKIPGYGFLTADEIGRMMNIPRDAPVRMSALATFLVAQECDDKGHTYISDRSLRQRLTKTEPLVDFQLLIEHGQKTGDLTIVEDERRGRRIYATKLYEAEQALAQDLHDLLVSDKPMLVKSFEAFRAKALEVSHKLLGYELDDDQIRALHGIATSPSRVHAVTAGPGCGKTAIMEVFCAMMGHKSFAFAAPTGKAAKVLTARVERQGYVATTLNSLLQGSVEEGFNVNRTDPMEVDVLVVDEGTMPELRMAAAVTAALGPHTHLVVLGDPGIGNWAGQLPSIGPGRVMSDLLQLPGIDHHHLTAVKRNSGGILEVVNQIRAGVLDCEDHETVKFSHTLGDADAAFPLLAAQYLSSVAAKGIENVVLLMSRRRGSLEQPGWNSDYANARLRDMCNPHALSVPGSNLHVGDRIIVRENMTIGEDEQGEEIRVVNGDTGTLLRYQANPDPKYKAPLFLVLKLDDGQVIHFPGDAMSALQHSYALTVHSSQGSEYKEVLLVMTPGMPSFINTNMFLTGASRAKEQLYIFGNDSELRHIAATPLPPRNSTLVAATVERLEETLRQFETEAAAAAPKT